MRMDRLIPMLPVSSMPSSVDWYQKIGFSVENRNDGWGWAMLKFDECRLMIDQSINPHPGIPRLGIVYLYPDDIFEYHKSLRESGLAIDDLDETFYGMVEFRLDDPDGNHLWIGQDRSKEH